MWRLTDALSGSTYDRDGSGMFHPGLYVELGPWETHCFHCEAAASRGVSAVHPTKEKAI
jgi:hypothetical protein